MSTKQHLKRKVVKIARKDTIPIFEDQDNAKNAPPENLFPVLATMMQRIASIVCRENFKRRKVQVRVLFAPLDLCKTILRNLTVCRAILDVIKTKMVKFNVSLVVLGNLNNTVGSQVVQIAQLDLNLSTPVPSVPSVMLEKQERDVTRVTPVNTVQVAWIPVVAPNALLVLCNKIPDRHRACPVCRVSSKATMANNRANNAWPIQKVKTHLRPVVNRVGLARNRKPAVPSVRNAMPGKQEREPMVPVTRVTPVNTVQATWIPAVATVAREGSIKIKKCKRLVYPVSPVRSVPTKDKNTV